MFLTSQGYNKFVKANEMVRQDTSNSNIRLRAVYMKGRKGSNGFLQWTQHSIPHLRINDSTRIQDSLNKSQNHTKARFYYE